MRISELLQKESIALGRKPQDKADAIGQMVELLAKSGSLEDKKKFKQAILERERLSTTGIGEGIAIPHGKSSAVKRAAVAAILKEGWRPRRMLPELWRMLRRMGLRYDCGA